MKLSYSSGSLRSNRIQANPIGPTTVTAYGGCNVIVEHNGRVHGALIHEE